MTQRTLTEEQAAIHKHVRWLLDNPYGRSIAEQAHLVRTLESHLPPPPPAPDPLVERAREFHERNHTGFYPDSPTTQFWLAFTRSVMPEPTVAPTPDPLKQQATDAANAYWKRYSGESWLTHYDLADAFLAFGRAVCPVLDEGRAREVAEKWSRAHFPTVRHDRDLCRASIIAAIHELTKGPICGSSGDGLPKTSPLPDHPANGGGLSCGSTTGASSGPSGGSDVGLGCTQQSTPTTQGVFAGAADAASELLSAEAFAAWFYGRVRPDDERFIHARDAAIIAFFDAQGECCPMCRHAASELRRHLKGGGK